MAIGRGFRRADAGSLIWFSIAATGLAAIAASFAKVLVVIHYAGAVYLLSLAWSL